MEYAVDTAPPMTEEDMNQRRADEESKQDRDIKEEDEDEEEDEEELQFVLNTEDVGKTDGAGSFLRKPTFLRQTNNKGAAPFGFNKQASAPGAPQNQIQGQIPQITGSTVVIAGTVHPVNYHLYNALVGGYVANQKSALELEEIEDKQWRKPGADITDYFNYGFNEDTWKSYTAKQVQLRLEQSMQSKIKVWTSAQEQPQMNQDMPPELLVLSGSAPSPRMRSMQTQAIPVVGGNSPPSSQTPSWDRPSSSSEHRRRPRDTDDSVIQVLASAEEGGRSGAPEGEFPGFPPGMRPPFPGGVPPMGMPMPMPPGYDRGYPPRGGRDERERRFPASDRPPSERDFFDEHAERDREDRHRRDDERRRDDYDRRRDRDDRDRRERDKESSSSSSSRDRESRREREDDHKRHKRDDDDRKRRRDH
mmetsp:Transcript_6469/g.8987  ORF Transcript_6469/g.8987 Transcript_6469/m.8987 type:complete len:419 (+) Transcript_6469:74-1330(+)